MNASVQPVQSYAIRGVLTLRSPAFQTAPDTSGNKSQTFQSMIRTPDGRMVRLPYISAASIRGLLRRAAGEHLWKHFRSQHDLTRDERYQVTRETFLSVNRGSAGRKDMKPGAASLQDNVAGRRNVFSGLFGGGYYMHHSGLHMEAPLTPLVLEAIQTFPARYQTFCSGSAFAPADQSVDPNLPRSQRLSIVETYYLMPRDDFESGGGVGVIENHEEALATYMQDVASSKEAKREQKSAQLAARAAGQRMDIKDEDRVTLTTTKNMLELRAIAPGTQLYFGMILKAVTQAQLGLALLALRDWANANSLGGGSARGFGSFTASLSLESADGVLIDSTLLQGDAPFCQLSRHDLLDRAVSAAQAEIGAMDRRTLEQVYPLAPAADENKKPGRGKGASKQTQDSAESVV